MVRYSIYQIEVRVLRGEAIFAHLPYQKRGVVHKRDGWVPIERTFRRNHKKSEDDTAFNRAKRSFQVHLRSTLPLLNTGECKAEIRLASYEQASVAIYADCHGDLQDCDDPRNDKD